MSRQRMSDEEWEAYIEESKTCSRCHRTFRRGDFPMSTARGRALIRSWCARCLKRYYAEAYEKCKERRRMEAAQGRTSAGG